MPLPFLAIAAGLSALSGAAKTGIGIGQSIKGNKGFNRTLANRPMYDIPKEYQDVLTTYQRLAASNKFPGQDILEGKIGQSTARATGAAERGAISSTAYQGAVGNIYQKELDALQNLGVQAEQYKSQQQDKLASAQQMMGGLKTEQWNINKYTPWQTEMNRYSEMKQTGVQNLFSGLGDIMGSLSNFAGTQSYLDVIKKLYPKEIPATEDLSKYKVDINNPYT